MSTKIRREETNGVVETETDADELRLRVINKRIKELKSLIQMTHEVGDKYFPDDPSTAKTIAYLEEEIRRLEEAKLGNP